MSSVTSEVQRTLKKAKRRPFPYLPEEPTEEDLARDWTLNKRDREAAWKCHRTYHQRWFGLQLCALRQWGCFLEPEQKIPVRILNHVGQQLNLSPVKTVEAPSRPSTRVELEKRICAHLGFERFDERAEQQLVARLSEKAIESILPEELLWAAEDLLRSWKVVRPAASTLERLVASVFVDAQGQLFERIAALLSPSTCAAMDALLEVPDGERSSLAYLKRSPPAASDRAMVEYLNRHEQLASFGLLELDWSEIPAPVVWYLSELVRQYDVWALRRFPPVKRHALLGCFLLETHKALLDHLPKMHDQLIIDWIRRSKRTNKRQCDEALDDHLLNLPTLVTAGKVLRGLQRRPNQRISLAKPKPDALDRAIGSTENFMALAGGLGWVEQLRRRYRVLRRYWPQFLELPLKTERPSSPVLHAVEIARRFYRESWRELPKDTPYMFMEAPLRQAVRQADGKLDPQIWHLGLALAVKEALREGELILPGSHRHVSLQSMLYPAKRWQTEGSRVCQQMGLPQSGEEALRFLRQEMDRVAAVTLGGLATNRWLRLKGNELGLARLPALEIPERIRELRQLIQGMLPIIRIEDLLREVDRLCHFSQAFRPLDGYQPQGQDRYLPLLATLIAHGTNLGIAAMGSSVRGLSGDGLQHISQWFIREATLKAANALMVNFHHRLPLSSIYGQGHFSSSDGQRFRLRRSSLIGVFYPRYFGYYGKAVGVYTHLSDQFSVFNTQVITCLDREALYVLDGLLDHQTDLVITEHTADTHGYTEQMFGLCFLLGYSFMPRIKGAEDQYLYRMDASQRFGELDPFFVDTVDVALILEQWDALVRLAASLRQRLVPAHIVLQRLRYDSCRLGRALTALGRVVKTIFLLRYMADAELRRHIGLQLNRGENRHCLARWLFFAQQGELAVGDLPGLINKASCLSLLSNAVLTWNTVQFEKIVTQLRSQGHTIQNEDLAHVTPLLFGHIIPHGAYFVNQPDLGG